MLLRTVLMLLAAACACAQPVSVPDTSAGRVLQAWLDAFNSGDRTRIAAYFEKYRNAPMGSADGAMTFRDQSGGLQLLAIDKSADLRIEFRVKEVASPTTAIGKLLMKSPDEVTSFTLRAIPPGLTPADMALQIDAATRSRVLDGVIAELNDSYVFPETASKMEKVLRTNQKAAAYDIADADDFANKLTSDLQETSGDKHLRVSFLPSVLPKDWPPRNPEMEARRQVQIERNNCAFDKVERLSPNVGYVKFNIFFDPSICGPTATAAMNFLGNVDALIIDLRENGGGDPKMVAFLASYLFPESTHLNDIYNRKEDRTTQYWTLPYVPGKKLTGKPVYVLTSTRTFSAAEDFTYALKMLKRATIVGETTGGGAHPTQGHRVDDHFLISVPFARSLNPISKTDWEGTGVEPDVKVSAAEALESAIRLASEQVKKQPL